MTRVSWLLFIFFVSCTSAVFAQGAIPFIAGAQVETGVGSLPDAKTGTGIVRVTPFLGVWLQGLGYAKLGGSVWKSSLKDSLGAEHGYNQRDIGVQLGASLGGLGRPYVIASYTYAKQLSDLGDASWKEMGLGLGTLFQISPLTAIVLEGEYRWVDNHYDPVHDLTIQGTRIQLNMGFLVYFF